MRANKQKEKEPRGNKLQYYSQKYNYKQNDYKLFKTITISIHREMREEFPAMKQKQDDIHMGKKS